MRCLFLPLLLAASAACAGPQVLLPRTGLTAGEVALLVNEDDPLSRQVGEYYRRARGIPEENVIRLRFAPERAAMPKEEFLQQHSIHLASTTPHSAFLQAPFGLCGIDCPNTYT